MYRLTPRMVQLLRKSLGKYHELFFGGRCSGWQLEELIVASINSDTQAQHKAMWKEAGHDHEADITVDTGGGNTHPIQVKSGKHSESLLTLSGHRLGRYRGSLEEITKFLNCPKADVLSVPYRQENDGEGRKHVYSVWYIDAEKFSGLDPDSWDDKGSCFEQSNREGVLFSLRPSMSWQVWWKIPLSLIDKTDEFSIS